MVQRRHHYESAFEDYLRHHRIPYLAVDEARRSLLPPDKARAASALKSFDLVIYTATLNLLVDVKGRRAPGTGTRRMENWVTRRDLTDLHAWEDLFGTGFQAAFVFIYWCHEQPPDGIWAELFSHRGRWYAPRLILRRHYARHHTPRSPRWQTVQLPRATFTRLSRPFTPSPPSTTRHRTPMNPVHR
ncbi:MAG: HYExAFE family protein [Phycisphaerales bacterium]|nr:HYExAFE family protein [Phycisphaerales bacterium]